MATTHPSSLRMAIILAITAFCLALFSFFQIYKFHVQTTNLQKEVQTTLENLMILEMAGNTIATTQECIRLGQYEEARKNLDTLALIYLPKVEAIFIAIQATQRSVDLREAYEKPTVLESLFSIQQVVIAAKNSESSELSELTVTFKTSQQQIVSAATASVVGCFILLIIAIGLNALEYRKRILAERALALANTQLEERVKERTIELEKANRAKTEFLAIISHEIRTPLFAIAGYSDDLSESNLSEEQRESVEGIVSGSQTLLQIITQILEYSSFELQDVHLEEKACTLEEIIEETRLTLPVQNNQLQFKAVQRDILSQQILLDKPKVKQVLINLCNNALKFSGPIAKVEVTIRKSEQLWIDVTDNGPGIPKEQQEKLFTPFQQGDSTTRRQFGGVGLGLSVCKRLITKMGGTIKLVSELGKGTTVSFSLPFKPTLVTTQLPEYTNLPQYKILVVEDAPINLKLVVRMLKALDQEVLTATSGEEAITCVKSTSVDLVFMDIEMPGMDGFETCQRIKQEVGDPPKIIAFTAHALPAIFKRCKDCGMDGWVSKPVTKKQLAETLHTYLTKKSGHL